MMIELMDIIKASNAAYDLQLLLLLLVPLLGQRGSEAATLYLRFFLHLVPRSPSRRAPRRCLPGRAGPGPGPCCCG